MQFANAPYFSFSFQKILHSLIFLEICQFEENQLQAHQMGHLQPEECGDPAASERAALLNVFQIRLSALQKWKQQFDLLIY